MRELTLVIPTADGGIPAFAAVPQDTAIAPGVLIFMDIFGPREELRDIARRFASCGYAAVLPNLFHRVGSPEFAPANAPQDPVPSSAVQANDATTLQMTSADSRAIIDFAGSGGLGLPTALFGAIGYCMGGRHAIAAALAHPAQIRAALCIHGGRLVDAPGAAIDGLIGHTTVPLHFAFAREDPTCPPHHQSVIERAAAAANGLVTIEHIDALHGWSFPDRWCFDVRASERVWETALAMFRSAL